MIGGDKISMYKQQHNYLIVFSFGIPGIQSLGNQVVKTASSGTSSSSPNLDRILS